MALGYDIKGKQSTHTSRIGCTTATSPSQFPMSINVWLIDSLRASWCLAEAVTLRRVKAHMRYLIDTIAMMTSIWCIRRCTHQSKNTFKFRAPFVYLRVAKTQTLDRSAMSATKPNTADQVDFLFALFGFTVYLTFMNAVVIRKPLFIYDLFWMGWKLSARSGRSHETFSSECSALNT